LVFITGTGVIFRSGLKKGWAKHSVNYQEINPFTAYSGSFDSLSGSIWTACR